MFNNMLMGAAGQSTKATGGYQVDNSMLLVDSDNDHLTQTFSLAPTNQKKFTVSMWVKRNHPDEYDILFGGVGASATTGRVQAYFHSNGALVFEMYHGSGWNAQITDMVFRDVHAWYNIMCVMDIENSTEADRMRVYVNGSRVTFSSSGQGGAISPSFPATSMNHLMFNNAQPTTIGNSGDNNYFDGYIAEVVGLDGQALTDMSTMGETDDNGVWRPIDPTSNTFGNNGFYLPFSNSVQLGVAAAPVSSTAATVSFLQVARDSGSATNYTFSSQNLGTAASGRIIAVHVASERSSAGARTVSSLTVAGVSAALVVRNTTPNGDAHELWEAQVPSGTSGDVVVNHSGSMVGSSIALYAIYNAKYQQHYTVTDSGTTLSQNLVIPNNSIAIAGASDVDADVGTGTFTGVTERFDQAIEASGQRAFAGGDTSTNSGTGATTIAFAGASSTHADDVMFAATWFPSDGPNNLESVNSPTQTTDTPTDNHATFSPLLSNASKVTLSEGNMRGATSTSSGHVGLIVSGFELPTSGKYYWEWLVNTVGTTPALGWRSIENLDPNGHTSGGNNQAEFITGTDYNTGSGRILSSTIDGSTSLSQAAYGNFLTVSGGNPLANGTVLGCAYDADNGLAWFSYNNTWVDGNGTDSSSTVKSEIEAGTSGSQAFTTANGAVGEAGLFITAKVSSVSSGDFSLRTRSEQWTGDCPSGFTPVSTKNQAAAVTYAILDGSAHHQTTLYTGSGNAQSITQDSTANNNFAKNSTFKPDLLWLRGRETYPPNSSLYDVQHSDSTNPNRLTPNLNSAAHDDNESSANKAFESFDVKGFSFQGGGNNSAPNASSKTMTAWQWLADNTTGSTSGFTQGSLTSTVSKNQTAGFSIVTWTGNGGSGGAQTIGHGLGRKPNMIWVKNRTDAENWVVYHDDIGFNAGTLNSDAARITTGASVYWNDTAFTENVFTVNTHNGVNGDGDSMVAYCFASIPGYSKFSAYIGNNSTNGPFIDLGFKPSWIMIKAITTVESWWIGDNARYGYNDRNRPMLAADLTDAENTGWSNNPPWDALSNGFKIRRQGGAFNTDGNSYLYAAFASNPFAGPTPNTAR